MILTFPSAFSNLPFVLPPGGGMHLEEKSAKAVSPMGSMNHLQFREIRVSGERSSEVGYG